MKDRNSKLRDKFAVAALQGILSDPKVRCDKPEKWAEFVESLSEECYELADAMLVARNKGMPVEGMTAEVAAPEHSLPYEEWQKGDVLRVVATEYGDPFKVGDLVMHDDTTTGTDVPYVKCGSIRYPMAADQLEFIRRPEKVEERSDLHYSTWKAGDKLRIVATEPGDPFKVGDLVIHADTPGNAAPFVRLGSTCYAMANRELEFVSRSTLPTPPYHQWQKGDLLQVTEVVGYTPEGVHVGQYVVYCDATVGSEVPYVTGGSGIKRAIPVNHLKFIARP